MNLQVTCRSILRQLTDVIEQIDEKEFVQPIGTLSQSTIGQHLRHTLEFFLCLEKGFAAGVVNYDKRAHDKLIEQNREVALGAISRILHFVEQTENDHPLRLEVGYELDSDDFIVVDTNYFRELTYNIEHAVHHMALIKIGLREVAPYVNIAPHFGVAASSVRYQEKEKAG